MKKLITAILATILLVACQKEKITSQQSLSVSNSENAIVPVKLFQPLDRAVLIASDMNYIKMRVYSDSLILRLGKVEQANPNSDLSGWAKKSMSLYDFNSLCIRTGFTGIGDYLSWEANYRSAVISLHSKFIGITDQNMDDAGFLTTNLSPVDGNGTPQGCVYGYQSCSYRAQMGYNIFNVTCFGLGVGSTVITMGVGGVAVYMGCGAIAIYNLHLARMACATDYKKCMVELYQQPFSIPADLKLVPLRKQFVLTQIKK